MDTLAGTVSQSPSSIRRIADQESLDLATMQHYQAAVRQNNANLRNSDLQDPAHSSPVVARPDSDLSVRSGPSTPSLQRGSVVGDVQPGDAPSATVQPRVFKASSLSESDLQNIAELTKQLTESTYLYESHVNLIKLLRQGFLSHIAPPDDADNFNDPNDYPLLNDLRQAREAMDTRFPVGEQFWVEWLQDECMLANSIEDRVAVMELCKKAVQEEVGSVPLWRLYGDWMWLLFKKSHNVEGVYQSCSLEQAEMVGTTLGDQAWTEEDVMLGQEIFAWEAVLEVWQQGVKATEWHINDSHVIWNPYMELVLYDFSLAHANLSSSERIAKPRKLFLDRLRQPHSTWDETFQMFSSFVSQQQGNESYEQTMIDVKGKAKKAKHEYELRQQREFSLSRAIQSNDLKAEWETMTEYLEWESGQHKKKTAPNFSRELYAGLCERASLRFPTESEFWEDHLDLLMEHPIDLEAVIGLSHRATRHCPWSGALWARSLYALEAAKKPYGELEATKHLATSSGLLEEVGGLDELVKVYTAWCGYLRRRAFAPGATEDERDIAEVAIRSAIESVQKAGEKRYGRDNFKGDPFFRTDRLYLKFLAQAGGYDEGRRIWQQLSIAFGDHYEFWNVYYLWEMTTWGLERGKQVVKGGQCPLPEHATQVLQRAIRRPNVEWPEKLIDNYLHHCSQHESIEKLQEAQIEARRVSRQVAKRRAREAAENAHLQQQLSQKQEARPQGNQEQSTGAELSGIEDSRGKRKRDQESDAEAPVKRTKGEDQDTLMQQQPLGDASSSATSQLKRDREHTTVLVRHLPGDVTEEKIRKFFRDCGDIHAVTIVHEDDDDGESTATVEFEAKEDALTAQTKAMKSFDGHAIDVSVGTGTTLWVTNYPPEADEHYIRNLFKTYGDVLEVRFPSLKLNTHRRFCYVQFLTSAQARSATQLDGKALEGNMILSAKISDPGARQGRTGAMHEGREIYVSNVDWSAAEEDVKSLFSKYGSVEHVRMPRTLNGKSKGQAFVAFAEKAGANAALEMHLKDFKGRILTVTISRPNAKGAKKGATTIVGTPDNANSTAGSPPSTTSNDLLAPPHERSFALLRLPDTVNDSQVRSWVEPHAAVRKIVLRPFNRGAIVELERVADVGKASLALDGMEVTGGARIGTGTVNELKKHKENFKRTKEDGSATGGDPHDTAGSKPKNSMQSIQPIRRPGLGAGGRGRERAARLAPGGTSFRKAGSPDVEKTTGINGTATPAGEAGKGKSQADFRAMVLGAGAKPASGEHGRAGD